MNPRPNIGSQARHARCNGGGTSQEGQWTGHTVGALCSGVIPPLFKSTHLADAAVYSSERQGDVTAVVLKETDNTFFKLIEIYKKDVQNWI